MNNVDDKLFIIQIHLHLGHEIQSNPQSVIPGLPASDLASQGGNTLSENLILT